MNSQTLSLNAWYTNLAAAVSLILCYTAVSQIFIDGNHELVTAPVFISSAIQSRMQSQSSDLELEWSFKLPCPPSVLFLSRHVIPWSSNPINTTLACLHHGTQHRRGHCMLSAPSTEATSAPTSQKAHQPSIRRIWPVSKTLYTIYLGPASTITSLGLPVLRYLYPC